MRKIIPLALFVFTFFVISAFSSSVSASTFKLKVTITNITKSIILTPPIVATSRKPQTLFTLGEPSSTELAMVAEGGDTAALAELLTGAGIDVVTFDGPILPASSESVIVTVRPYSYLHLASMLLPTNDAFIGLNGFPLRKLFTPKNLVAYDSGTELNDEICANIPGPQCGGEGFNSGGGEGIVHPHPGIHGEAELSRAVYSWGNPVAQVKVEFVY